MAIMKSKLLWTAVGILIFLGLLGFVLFYNTGKFNLNHETTTEHTDTVG